MKTLSSLGFVLLATASFWGCERDASMVGPNAPADAVRKVDVGTGGSGISTQTLFAGQTINAGTVGYDDVDTDSNGEPDALQVTYTLAAGWQITEAHLFVGATLAELPTNKSGNPQVGQFPYKSGALTGKTTHTFTIPFSTIGFTYPPAGSYREYFVAAHASLRNTTTGASESAWGNGQRLVQRGNWAMYNMIYISRDVAPPPAAATTETAFAYSTTSASSFSTFSDFIDNPSRWGWSNGPLAQGTYSLPIYAGAAQSDISKGTLVGSLSINYSGSTAVITYNITGTNAATGMPYTLKEAHLYAGSEVLPRDKKLEFTIAPGQYPYKASNLAAGATSQSFTVTGLSGSIYVVAHAVVHGFPLD